MTDLGYAKEDCARAADRAIAAGTMTPSALDDFVVLYAPEVTYLGGRAMIGAKGLDAALADLIAERPHWRPSPVAPDLDMNNLADRAKAMRELRPDEFKVLLSAWGLRGPGDARRGVPPVSQANGDGDKGKKPDRANPWLAANWNISKQGELIKAIGAAKAAEIAKAARSYIGATRPVM